MKAAVVTVAGLILGLILPLGSPVAQPAGGQATPPPASQPAGERFVKLDSALTIPAGMPHVIVGNVTQWQPALKLARPETSLLCYFPGADMASGFAQVLEAEGGQVGNDDRWMLVDYEALLPFVVARGPSWKDASASYSVRRYGSTRIVADAVAAAGVIEARGAFAARAMFDGVFFDNWSNRLAGYDPLSASMRPHPENLELAAAAFRRGWAATGRRPPRIVVNCPDPWNSWHFGEQRWISGEAAVIYLAARLRKLEVEVYFETFDLRAAGSFEFKLTLAFLREFARLEGRAWLQFANTGGPRAQALSDAAGANSIRN